MNNSITICSLKSFSLALIFAFSFAEAASAHENFRLLGNSDTCIHCETNIVTVVDRPTTESIATLLIKYALLLDTTVESLSNLPLYQFIDEWIGVPYKYGGNDLSGIDCSSFAGTLYQKIYGLSLPRTSYEQSVQTDPVLEANLKRVICYFFKPVAKKFHMWEYILEVENLSMQAR